VSEKLKTAAAAARARWPTWAIEWRGKITRDVGVDYEQQPSVKQAREAFINRYPSREILSVSRAGKT
jgi:hypothetical protein